MTELTPRAISLNFLLSATEREMRDSLEAEIRRYALIPLPDTFALEVIEEGRQRMIDAYPEITLRWVKAEMDGIPSE